MSTRDRKICTLLAVPHNILLGSLWICLTASIIGKAEGALTMEINKDFFRHDDDGVDACNLNGLDVQPGYCYCLPDSADPAEDVKCAMIMNPAEKVWRALSRLEGAKLLEFVSRPAGVITQLPPYYVFVGMKSLQYFTMKFATVSTIPSLAFGNSSSLVQIDLRDSAIHELLPNAFANLQNLSVINLSENNLTEISAGVFTNLPKLKELILMKNSIYTVHDYAFTGLGNLEDLALQENRLSVITRDVFSGLERLKNLDLHGNHIEYIGDHVFAEMPRLQDLDLNGNNILEIHPRGFAGLRFIARLNLKGNKIVNLNPDTFSNFNKIHFLDLRNNELETLSYSLMKPIYRNLKSMSMQLLLEGNRFTCDCHILWMQTLYNETQSENMKEHMSETSCDLFENTKRHAAASSASSSPTVFRTDGINSDITILTNPPEETTAYAFESKRSVLSLTEKELGCLEDFTQKPKRAGDITVGGNNRKVFVDFNGEIGEQHSQVEKFPEGRNEIFHHQHHRDSNLNEPQATAALEGGDFRAVGPKNSLDDQRGDTNRVNSHSSSSTASTCSICDSLALIINLFAGAYISTRLK